MRVRLAGCLALICLLAAPPPARAQIDSREGIALQNQILELHQEIESLRPQTPRASTSALGGYAQPTPLAPAAAAAAGGLEAQLLDRVQRLEAAMRELRGQVDDAGNTRQRQYEELNKKIDDLAFRLGVAPAPGTTAGTEAGAATAAGAAAEAGAPAGTPAHVPAADGATAPDVGAPLPIPPRPVPLVPAAKRTPELLLQEGNAALARHDYAAAEAAAKDVLANGKGPRATDAQFLMAQALAGHKDYSAAAVAYDDTYNRSHTGVHAPDSLLGLASALTAINEKRAACATLDKLRAEFPTPRADLKEPIAQARRSAGCH